MWSDYVIGPTGGLAIALNATTNLDGAIDQYVTNHTGTIWHPVGTASMSPVGAPWGVVDPDLKVKKVTGLRIVDASVFVSCWFVLMRLLLRLMNDSNL